MSVAADSVPALTEFVEESALREMQNAFAALTGVATSIRDARGAPVTETHHENDFCRRLLDHPASAEACRESHVAATLAACTLGEPCQRECHAGLTQFAAPITVGGQRLGAIIVGDRPRRPLSDEQVREIAERFDLDYDTLRRAAWGLRNWSDREMTAATRFAQLFATTLARLCYQGWELQQRVRELSTVYHVSTLLAGERDLQSVLNLAAKLVTDVLNVKAAGIRLLNEDTDELKIAAVHNLSADYLNKGPLHVSASPIDAEALSGKVVYVEDMPNDPRTVYKEEAAHEGIHSALVTSLTYRGHSIGVMRVYAEGKRAFSALEVSLLRAVAAQAAAAIIHARMRREAEEAAELERQVRLAGEVQMRMLPASAPRSPNIEFGCVYQPSSDLGGDFYDFIELPEQHVGIVIADVVGKGVPASLLMAAAKASLRAHTKSIYHIDRIISEVNRQLCRDTRPEEFVTAFYGVLDSNGRRFTFCNAGHEPAILLRDGGLRELDVDGTVLGIQPGATYERGVLDLRGGDILVFVTDGLLEAMDYNERSYGRQRLHESIRRHAALPAAQMANQLVWDVRRFAGLAPQTDDMTVVVAKVR